MAVFDLTLVVKKKSQGTHAAGLVAERGKGKDRRTHTCRHTHNYGSMSHVGTNEHAGPSPLRQFVHKRNPPPPFDLLSSNPLIRIKWWFP